jgi:hypothetical protein
MNQPLLSRRHWLQLGGLSLLTSTLPKGAIAEPASGAVPRAFARRCIFIMLQGGPSHLELWDPKPQASEEVRGPLGTISTAIPGIAFGELIPRMAGLADRLTVIRSMTHQFTNHIAGTYITLTGSENQPDRDREAHADDFPGPGAVLNYLPGPTLKVPRSVSLPNWLSIPGPSNRMPGQYGGMLGAAYDPFLIEGDPNRADYDPLSLHLTQGMTVKRLETRLTLLQQVDRLSRQLEGEMNQRYDRLQQSAFDLVADGRVRRALDVAQESDAVRNQYGRDKFGQSLLLARRLIEAGVTFVAYNDFNQKWDTHGDLLRRYRQIIPPLDQAFSALVEDLQQRGLLDETLVVLTGEFGRTPRINDLAGRDHWPNAYSSVMCGGGFRPGVVHGTTDAHGAEVIEGRVAPADVLATMWHQLGVSPTTVFHDRLERPHPISSGRVLHEMLG